MSVNRAPTSPASQPSPPPPSSVAWSRWAALALTGDLGGGTTTVVRTSPAPTRRRPGRGTTRGSQRRRDLPRAPHPASSRSPRRHRGPGHAEPRSSPFNLPEAPPQQALGSGFVIDKAGHIVTNYHVIEGADQIEVSFSNQDTLRATLVGSDPSTDIAVLRVEASSRSLTPLVLGNSDAVARRRPGRRDRQPVRAGPDDDCGDRQRRPGADDHRAERLPDRPRDPDRRADQQRQLGRPAA